MKGKITLISTIILSILLLLSLYYGFFIKPKEITYTSFIPTTFSTTKSLTETSYITKTEKETIEKTYSTIKTETLISTYRIIEDEALIEINQYIDGWVLEWKNGKPLSAFIAILSIIVNTGEHTLFFDKNLILIKGIEKYKIEYFFLPFKRYHNSLETIILTSSNRTILLTIPIIFNASELPEEHYNKEHKGEIFITYKIIEINQFRTFNSTFTYYIWKTDD